MIRFAENLNKMIAAGLGGAMEAPSTEVALGHRIRYLEASGAVATFETNVAALIQSLTVDLSPIQEGTGEPSPDNIRPITGRDAVRIWRESEYDPSAAPAFSVQLGQTVYGGTVDLTTGKMTVNMAAVDMGTLPWSIPAGYNLFLSSSIPNAAKKIRWKALSPVYRNQDVLAPNLDDFSYTTRYNDGRIRLTDSRYSTADDFRNAVTGVPFVYEIDPVEISLTPVQLTTLKGQNNVWSDADSVTLEYPYQEETEGY